MLQKNCTLPVSASEIWSPSSTTTSSFSSIPNPLPPPPSHHLKCLALSLATRCTPRRLPYILQPLLRTSSTPSFSKFSSLHLALWRISVPFCTHTLGRKFAHRLDAMAACTHPPTTRPFHQPSFIIARPPFSQTLRHHCSVSSWSSSFHRLIRCTGKGVKLKFCTYS